MMMITIHDDDHSHDGGDDYNCDLSCFARSLVRWGVLCFLIVLAEFDVQLCWIA